MRSDRPVVVTSDYFALMCERDAALRRAEQAEQRERIAAEAYNGQQSSYRELETLYQASQERAIRAGADAAAREDALGRIREYIEDMRYGRVLSDRDRALVIEVLAAVHPGTALLAERQRLLVVAYEAYQLSLHIEEFDGVVSDDPVEMLDRSLMKAFGVTDLAHFFDVGEAIATALGGYAAAMKARRE